jgi:hypothetical protein
MLNPSFWKCPRLRPAGVCDMIAPSESHESEQMTTREALAAVLTTLGDRFPPIQNEIGRREYPPDLDNRITLLAHDLEAALAKCGELTPDRRKRLADVAGELQTGRAALASNRSGDAWAAFARAAGCIDTVAVDVMHGPVL